MRPKPEHSEPKVEMKGKWITMKSMTFKRKDGTEGLWEFVCRTSRLPEGEQSNSTNVATTQGGCSDHKHPEGMISTDSEPSKQAQPCKHICDGVSIIPIIKKGDKRSLLLIAEFRYPVGKWVLCFPGGKP